ncbi:MAG: septal ring lytic transglycosylase RlpA family protein [Methylobacter sp.]|nr:septal ring lytic transglycosylase RlpA family protein [Methylobacter sp.]
MLHLIIQYQELDMDNKGRLTSGYYRIARNFKSIISRGRLPKRFSDYLVTGLVCGLILSGCSSERSGDQAKQMSQDKEVKENINITPGHKEIGEASWYGPGFHGQETANGDTFDQKKLTAAHPTLPLGTKAQVTNLENNKKVQVTINDRGPYTEDRAIDLSRAAAKKLDMVKGGTTKVKIETKPVKKKKSTAKSLAKKKKSATKSSVKKKKSSAKSRKTQ